MSVLQIQTKQRSDGVTETEDVFAALKLLAEAGVGSYATPTQSGSRHASIIVEDEKAPLAACILKVAGFRAHDSPANASDAEIPVQTIPV